jgi:NADPH:quinone reductase-like Zn-dependent oxidoreductase
VAAVKAGKAALKPAKLSHEEAASLVLVGNSAIQALDLMQLSAGQKILIHGGAGGIGSIAIQYAKHLGAYVAATARESDQEFVKNLGADEVIDYEKQKFYELLHDYDAAFDTVGGETYTNSFKVVKPGGAIASMLEHDEELANINGIKSIAMNTQINTENLNKLAKFVENGAIKPQIDKEFSLDEIPEAFKYAESGQAHGKVIIKVGDE